MYIGGVYVCSQTLLIVRQRVRAHKLQNADAAKHPADLTRERDLSHSRCLSDIKGGSDQKLFDVSHSTPPSMWYNNAAVVITPKTVSNCVFIY